MNDFLIVTPFFPLLNWSIAINEQKIFLNTHPFLSSLEFVPFVAVVMLGVVVFTLLVGFLATFALELLLVMGLGCAFFVFVALQNHIVVFNE